MVPRIVTVLIKLNYFRYTDASNLYPFGTRILTRESSCFTFGELMAVERDSRASVTDCLRTQDGQLGDHVGGYYRGIAVEDRKVGRCQKFFQGRINKILWN